MEDDPDEELDEENEDVAPETSEKTEDLVAWDEPVGESGERAPRVAPEDEKSPVEQLVREGVEEADREQRVAAEDDADLED